MRTPNLPNLPTSPNLSALAKAIAALGIWEFTAANVEFENLAPVEMQI